MDDNDTILNDKRKIESVFFNDGGGYSIAGGFVIEAYGEPGEYCYKPWIRVKQGDDVVARFYAERVSIYYQKPASQQPASNSKASES